MREDDPYKEARGTYPRPRAEGKAFDPFVTAMWREYRDIAPKQEKSGKNLKFVWEGHKGIWVEN